MQRLLFATLVVMLPAGAWAAEDGYQVTDPDEVYYGEARSFSAPAVLELAEVFEHIPAYREILDRNLTEEHAEYWLLLERANRVFEAVLEHLAKDEGFDLIAEVGAVVATGDTPDPPDVTEEALELAEDPEAIPVKQQPDRPVLVLQPR